jgi:hypothetical protein
MAAPEKKVRVAYIPTAFNQDLEAATGLPIGSGTSRQGMYRTATGDHMHRRVLAMAAAVTLSGLIPQTVVRAAGGNDARSLALETEQRIAQSADGLPALTPPVPRLVRRSPEIALSAAQLAPIVPPVPQPAVRPIRLAALPEPQLALPIPPVPRPAVRPSRRDKASEAQLACLKRPVRELLDRIEREFGTMKIVSTCRPGARIAGSGRISKHASGEAIDFEAGARKAEVVGWLVANHRDGGTMTYSDMSHIHVDIGHRFVALDAYSGR